MICGTPTFVSLNGRLQIMSDIVIKILWGFHEDPTEYTFKTQAEADAFLLGVDESNGWTCYEVEGDEE